MPVLRSQVARAAVIETSKSSEGTPDAEVDAYRRHLDESIAASKARLKLESAMLELMEKQRRDLG